MTHHTHKAIPGKSRTVGWSHCVAKPGSCCSGAAHGGVTHVDTCACGATRKTESNGNHVMRGAWEPGDKTVTKRTIDPNAMSNGDCSRCDHANCEQCWVMR